MGTPFELLRDSVPPVAMGLFVIALLIHLGAQAYGLSAGLGRIKAKNRYAGYALAAAAGIQLFAALGAIPLTYVLLSSFTERYGAQSLAAIFFGALLPIIGALLFAGAGVTAVFASALSRVLEAPKRRYVGSRPAPAANEDAEEEAEDDGESEEDDGEEE